MSARTRPRTSVLVSSLALWAAHPGALAGEPVLSLATQDAAQSRTPSNDLPAPTLLVSPQAGAEAAASEFDAEPDAGPTSFWSGWEGTVEGGVSGSEGNSENFNVRVGLGARRTTDEMTTAAAVRYIHATNEGDTSQHRAEADLRNDWTSTRSPWGFFTVVRAEYDEFQSWKYRTSAFLGPSYRVIDDERTTFKLRTGVGLTKEYGKQARNEIIPELDFGFDFEHKLTERQTISLTYDYYPSLLNFNEFRMEARGAWEILIDPDVNLSLKLGFEDRYTSEPGAGKNRNDLDYFAMIAWTF